MIYMTFSNSHIELILKGYIIGGRVAFDFENIQNLIYFPIYDTYFFESIVVIMTFWNASNNTYNKEKCLILIICIQSILRENVNCHTTNNSS